MRVRLGIALVLAVVAASCGGDDSPFGTSTSTTGGGASTSSTTTAGGAGWMRVPHDETVFGSGADGTWITMGAVTRGGPGLVAVGYDGSGEDWDAAVWTSPDGLSWSRVPHDEAVFGGPGDQALTAVVAGGPGLVAVGVEYLGEDWDIAVWTSADGSIWSRVPHDEAVFGGGDSQDVKAVVAAGPGLVAVGGDRAGGDTDAAVWTSPDGFTWAQAEDPDLGGAGDQFLSAVAVGGPGLVAVGDAAEGAPLRAAVWTSGDGLDWTRVPSEEGDDGADNQRMLEVVAGGPGFVAGGLVDQEGSGADAALWTSPDGVAWARVAHDPAIFGGPGDQWVDGFALLGADVVAVGGGGPGEGSGAAVWTSPDGLAWALASGQAALDGPDWQEMRAVVAGGPSLVAVGVEGLGEGAHAAVWVYFSSGGPTTSTSTSTSTTAAAAGAWSRVPHDDAIFGPSSGEVRVSMISVVAGGPGFVAVGYDGSGGDWDGAVWTSPDGLAWSRVPHDEAVFGGPGDQALERLVTGGPGLVALGSEWPGDDWDVAVWTSPDGFTWSRVPHDEAVFGGPSAQIVLAVAPGGPGLVAVGEDRATGDTDGAVWTSVDGLVWSRVLDEDLGGPGEQALLAVVAAGPGLVAVGGTEDADMLDGAVWTSPDGLAWSRVPHDEAVFGGPGSQRMETVVVGGPGLVAAGFTDGAASDTDAALWTSPDGLAWSRVPHDAALFGGPADRWVETLAVFGGEILCFGAETDGEQGRVVVWHSADGMAWGLVPLPEAEFSGPGWRAIRSVAIGGPGLVGVGVEGSGDAAHGAVWVYDASG